MVQSECFKNFAALGSPLGTSRMEMAAVESRGHFEHYDKDKIESNFRH